jgi:His-Xaa-Ser system radical SAM maturase HxsC
MQLWSSCVTERLEARVIGRITTNPGLPCERRQDSILLTRPGEPISTDGFAAVLLPQESTGIALRSPVAHSFRDLDYLADGDIVSIDPRGSIRTLYRRSSPHNFILMTEQCNSFCLMCSQPPRLVNDRDRIPEHLRLIELMDPETGQLGITGGEPTIFGDDFLRIVGACRDRLPKTSLHVLTNGRSFYYREFARRLGRIRHPDLVLGIPLYSSVDSHHDYVVQARGAFEETVIGIHHLAEFDVSVEIRVVLHAQTYRTLPVLAEFIARNFPFACHVALMGLEMFGFTRPNVDTLWIDPFDYKTQLEDATEILALAGLTVSIYNLQLCALDESLWPFAVKSISDWKNIYFPECDECEVRNGCGGMFQSAAWKHSAHIRPIKKV